MKNWKMLITALAVAVLGFLIFIIRLIAGGDEDAWICVAGHWEKHGNPSAAKPTTGCGENRVGADRDEHGCIGSAGYTWCQVKNKCLRTWEEKCQE
jgi:hypothetical protein